jgi:hypothetical protein
MGLHKIITSSRSGVFMLLSIEEKELENAFSLSDQAG